MDLAKRRRMPPPPPRASGLLSQTPARQPAPWAKPAPRTDFTILKANQRQRSQPWDKEQPPRKIRSTEPAKANQPMIIGGAKAGSKKTTDAGAQSNKGSERTKATDKGTPIGGNKKGKGKGKGQERSQEEYQRPVTRSTRRTTNEDRARSSGLRR